MRSAAVFRAQSEERGSGMQSNDIKIGDLLADKYRVERVLGRGGMGTVVAAWHQDLQERRAIKLMLPKAAEHAEAVERFLREARAAARLKSPHAVKIHDVARLPTGAPYIVMEYLEGMDLEKLLQSRGPLSMAEACRYILQACEAIGEAHASGIVHRDLKPANLFITTDVRGDPFVKVLDFGIAKVARSMEVDSPSLTVAHSTMGTPAYMSPEHINDSKTVDGRSDIWSLGVILYQLTTGALPFVANYHALLYVKILDDREKAPPPSRVHSAITPEFDAVVLRCLERNVHARYQTIEQLVEALTPFTTGAHTRMHSSPGNLVTLPMSTVRLDRSPTPPMIERSTTPTVPGGPAFVASAATLQGGMERAARPKTFTRPAIVASAVASSLITGIAAAIIVASGRNADTSSAAPPPPIPYGSMPVQNKPTLENAVAAPSPTPEENTAASNSSAPAPAAPPSPPTLKPTGQKKQATTTKIPTNKEFSTRK